MGEVHELRFIVGQLVHDKLNFPTLAGSRRRKLAGRTVFHLQLPRRKQEGTVQARDYGHVCAEKDLRVPVPSLIWHLFWSSVVR